MKKVSIFMAIAAAASLASCTAQAPKANLKTDIDSLSYSIGMAQTQGLKGYLTGRLTLILLTWQNSSRFERRCKQD